MSETLAALATTALPSLAGASVVSGKWVGRFALGSLLGIVAMCLGGIVGGLAGHGLYVIGAAAGLVALVAFGRRRQIHLPTPADRWRKLTLIAILAIGAGLLTLSLFRALPGGDAWAIWSLKASAIFHTGSLSGPVFADHNYAFTHPDYPPLVPIWQALSFKVQGGTAVTWPTQFQLAWLWVSAAVVLVFATTRASNLLATAAVATWVASPAVIRASLSGQADAPSALLLATGAAVLTLLADEPIWPGALILAGCALTKNEGTVEALALTATLLITAVVRRRGRVGAAFALAPVVAAAALWTFVTRSRGATNDALSVSSLGRLSGSAIPGRAAHVVGTITSHCLDIRLWGLTIAVVLAAHLSRRYHWGILTAVALSFLVLILRYVTTPYQLAADMKFSLDRVLIAPIGLLAVAAAWSLMQTPLRISVPEMRRTHAAPRASAGVSVSP